MSADPPKSFRTVEELEEFLSRPGEALKRDLEKAPGDILILGVGGKMGPTLAWLAQRAAPQRRVIGVARFSEKGLRERLAATGIETISCDVLDRAAVENLPQAPNVICMTAFKFGATGNEAQAWAVNMLSYAQAAETFRHSRFVAFSTGCVYPYVKVSGGGASEDTPLNPPPGDYAWSCVGRERAVRYLSAKHGTAGRLVRLNYAIDMRYGVLHDVAKKIRDGAEIDVTMGHANVIWQGDANAVTLRCLAHATAPTSPLNVSGPETIEIRWLAGEFGKLLGKKPRIVGKEAETAWLTNASAMRAEFGPPAVKLRTMIEWTADWVARAMPTHGKPTHYEARDGKY